MVAQRGPACTVTELLPNLMPGPTRLTAAGGPSLAAGATLVPRFDGARTPRLEAACARLPRGGAGPQVPLVLDCAAAPPLPALDDDEGYRLDIAGDRVTVRAATEWGVLRALATLTQCLGGEPVPAVTIEDRPRFPWRGLMLDVARHFLPAAALHRTLDAMAVFKLNVLHLHLSDDQAFRFPSERFPELASEPHYTRGELERLVQAAADRGIRLVPELDVPGHVTAWLTARPEWGNRPAAPSRRFGVHRACLDPTRAAVREAVSVLFGELAGVFPDPYLHLGGDEVHPAWWSEDAAVAAFMADHGIADAAELQAWFTAEIAAGIVALGRMPLGWDEILHARVPASVAVQAWRGATARDRALSAGHDCIVSAPYYLDLMFPADVHGRFQPDAPEAALVALEDAMLKDPRLAHVAAGMAWTHQWRRIAPLPPAAAGGRLLGAEACLWSELVDEDVLDERLWGRMPALAEVFWSGAPSADDALAARLDAVRAGLPRWAGIDLDAGLRARVEAAGVTPAWWPLVEALEPVKWYGRLLGETALAARLEGREMPQSRPYDADTPLDRVVDHLPSECRQADRLRRLLRAELTGDQQAARALRGTAAAWAGLPERAGPEELAAPAQALRRVGGCLLGVLDDRLDAASARSELATLGRPFGEYLLGPVPLLADWVERRQARLGS